MAIFGAEQWCLCTFLCVGIRHHDCLPEVEAREEGTQRHRNQDFKVTEKGRHWMFVKVESMSLSMAT